LRLGQRRNRLGGVRQFRFIKAMAGQVERDHRPAGGKFG